MDIMTSQADLFQGGVRSESLASDDPQ